MNRRDFGVAMAAFAASASVAEGQDGVMSASKLYRFDQLPVVKNANGGETRAVMKGTVATGEFLEVHETMLPPGQMPHPPHKHRHSEMLMIREGSLEYWNNGKTEPMGPGDIAYNGSMVPHGIKNVGTTPAKYFVVAIGVQSPSEPVKV